jgi:hypothetical protein
MKTIITILLSGMILLGNASENKYRQAMAKAIEKLKYTSETSAFLEVANQFERISQNEKNEWLPLYYCAQCYIIVSYSEADPEKTDALLDKAQGMIDKAFLLSPNESELFALQAFLYPSRITVDPMGRGMEFVGKMNHALDEAIRINPDNPRAYYLRAITVLNMPEDFGGGTKAARPIFETAEQKFNKFIPATELSPNWVKEQNEAEMAKL